MSRAKRARTAGAKSLAGVSSSLFSGSSDFSISKLSATTSGRDTIIHNVKIVNQNNQLATFTAGAIAGSVITIGLYGGTGWAGRERVGSMERVLPLRGYWDDRNADMVMATSASPHALSFVFRGHGLFYPLKRCSTGIDVDMLFLDLLAILSAIGFVASRARPPSRLLIFTESYDSVNVLYGSARHFSNTLHDGVIRAIASAIEESGIDVRVEQVRLRDNSKARLLSHLAVDEYRHQYPSDEVCQFSSPRALLPPEWIEFF